VKRKAIVKRDTNETKIKIDLNLDGTGIYSIKTGIGFFDHMLAQVAKHGFIDMDVQCSGDLEVDTHHTVEDVGIVMGMAFSEALGSKDGISRYGSKHVPMDEALALCVLDFSGRPYLSFDANFTTERIGELEVEMIEEFFRAFSVSAACTLHINLISGTNNHHIAEAIFKAFGQALDQATAIDQRIVGPRSTKGVL
jgi:imidazoleglycerol-phosphate dehydratase